MSNIILIFVIVYLCLAMWDVVRVNSLIERSVRPGPSRGELSRRRRYQAWLSAGADWKPN